MTMQGQKETISIKLRPKVVQAIKFYYKHDPDFNRSEYIERLIIADLKKIRSTRDGTR